MADAAFILSMCFLFVYGFRLMARLDRFLSPGGKDSLLQPEYPGKPLRQATVVLPSGLLLLWLKATAT